MVKNKQIIWIVVLIFAVIAFSNDGFLGALSPAIKWSPEGHDMTNLDLSGLTTQTYGEDVAIQFAIRALRTTESADRGRNFLDGNRYFDGSDTYPGAGRYYYIQICDMNEPTEFDIRAGDFIEAVFGANTYIFYLPELKGDIKQYQGLDCVKLYPAEDGSTYWNSALTNLAGDNICTVTSWTPETNTVCTGTTFTQTNNCGGTRLLEGTKDCPILGTDEFLTSAEALVRGAELGCSGTHTHGVIFMPCDTHEIWEQTISESVCSGALSQMNSDITGWISGAVSRDILGQSIMNWVNC